MVLKAGERFRQPAAASDGVGVGPEQLVGGTGLEIETDANHLGPALQPGLSQHFEAIELLMAGDQGDQHLAGVMAHPQGQMLEAPFAEAMAIDWPVAGFQIPFERGDQGIDPRVEHRAAVHVDDPMAAAAVVAGLEMAVFAALQGDHGPIAIAQGPIRGQQGQHLGTEAGNSLQRLFQGALLPLLLSFVAERLQAAATAMVGEDAGRAAALGRRLQDAAQIGVQLAAALGQKPDSHTITGQGTVHKHNAPLQPADAAAVMGEVLDLKFDVGRRSVLLGHVIVHWSRPYRQPCKGALHLARRSPIRRHHSIRSPGLWSLQ